MAIDNHISWLNSSNILNSMEGIKLKIMSQFNKDVELLFKNPVLKFITSEKNYFYAKWKYFNWCLEFANESKFFKFIESKEPSINSTQTFLEIYSFDSITVSENYKIKEYAELINADNLFKDIEWSKVWKILVPIQYLYSLKFSNRFVNNYNNLIGMIDIRFWIKQRYL